MGKDIAHVQQLQFDWPQFTAWFGKKTKTAYQPAFSRSELEDAISRALPIPSVWIKRVLQESLSPDVIEEKRTLASTHSHDVLIETHWTDACTDRKKSYTVNIYPPTVWAFQLSESSGTLLSFLTRQSTLQLLYHGEKYSCYGYVWHIGRQSSFKLHTKQVWRWLILCHQLKTNLKEKPVTRPSGSGTRSISHTQSKDVHGRLTCDSTLAASKNAK